MTIKPTKAARLTLDNGDTVMLEYLGAGMFHTCYLDTTTKKVYSVTKDRRGIDGAEDYSKEILSHPTTGCDPSPHIPPVEYVGDLDGSDRRVYRMPVYQKLRAKINQDAWFYLKRLKQARQDAWSAVYSEQVNSRKMRVTDIGILVNQSVIELMDAPGVPQSLKDALDSLCDAASNYGASYVFEFSPRNVMVDENGTLILLDVLFNLEATEAIQAAREKKTKAAARW